jgi:hypothetical protein
MSLFHHRQQRNGVASAGPGGLPWSPRGDDVGLRIVDQAGYVLSIDQAWSVRDERGFTWWGKDLAQHVWSEPGFEDDGFALFRLHAQTDLLRDFDASPANLGAINAFAGFATTSGYLIDADAGTVRLAASLFAHEQIEDWARPIFKAVVATQAADAQIKAGPLAEATGARVAATGHPQTGSRPENDDMLNVLELFADNGRGAPPWQGAELEWVTSQVTGSPYVAMANGDATGLTVEFPFHRATSLLTVRTGETNPQLGKGLLMVLRLAPSVDEAEGVRFAAELTRAELETPMFAHYLGSWCWADSTLNFVTFLPNLAYTGQGSDVINFLASMQRRAQWAAETFWNDDWDANLDEDGHTLAVPAVLRAMTDTESET